LIGATGAPLRGIRVVEVSLGLSEVGAGMAASLPGALLRDFGADVVRVQSADRSTLDAGVEFSRVWDRGKEIVRVGDDVDPTATIAALARDADVLFATGPEESLERRGVGHAELARANPGLVNVRIRPSYNALGPVPDLELLVHARAGVLSQIRGHRPGPIFGDLTVAGAGAALTATVGALACLYERENTGFGGWVETSLYDGLLAILPMIIGRVQHPNGTTALNWEQQGPKEIFAYRCADGEYIQLWFGAKGAYEAFLDHMGDPPSEAGYMADLVGDAMVARSQRWAEKFATRDRSWWLDDLAGHHFRSEPVWRPAEALRDTHVREIGLSLECDDPDRGSLRFLGPVARVTSTGGSGAARQRPTGHPAPRLLSDVRVLDLSAYLAGPVGPLVLAELGADVVKVEPLTGDVHRNMEPLFAAGQRAKRAVALDLKAPGAAGVLERLFAWSDVVHHNARLGLAERLGYDEQTVRAVNPDVIYSFASGFGTSGPRAPLPANDHLMQALSGVEASQGGAGQPPTFLVWGAIDVTSGWLSAASILAALVAQRRSGEGQSVATSLLGAALVLKSGAFLANDEPVVGPVLDRDQLGYGAAYRLYRAGDGAWFALAVPDAEAWTRLRAVVSIDDLPPTPPPLRFRPEDGPQPAETLLEAAFAARPASVWVAALREAGVPVEPIVEVNRVGFIGGILDDPVNQQLGRVVRFGWEARGLLEQTGFPLRFGPAPRPTTRCAIPGLGEHTAEVLTSVGIEAAEQAALAASRTVVEPAV
jgi:crotonobetainyl-CoA:carnitine CoA-transferase CaiB-like acyl-CoA transferase